MIAETIALAEATLEALGLRLDEATGQYYYDTNPVKRWVLGDGGVSGNCELCDDNAAQGWIDQDGLFDSGVDESPAHPGCTCSVEYGDKRYRVYV